MSEQASNSTSEGLSSRLSAILSNPDILKRAATILPDILPLLGGISGDGNEKTDVTNPMQNNAATDEKENDAPSTPVAVLPKTNEDTRPDSLALINALKPYLSPERRRKLDRIYSMTKMIETMSSSFIGDGS